VRGLTRLVVALNVAAGLFCSFAVLGVAFFASPLRAYALLGVVVPFLGTALASYLIVRIEGWWDRSHAWIVSFAYAPLYFLVGFASLGDAWARRDSGVLIWLTFGAVTVSVSVIAWVGVVSALGRATPPGGPPRSRRSLVWPGAAGGVVLLASLIFGLSILAAERDVPAAQQAASTSEASPRTGSRGPGATIRFVNASDRTVDVFWEDSEGKEVLYRTLGPAEYYEQGTYESHSWVVRSRDDGNVRLRIVSDGAFQMAAID
jgi:hypothetical protein